MVTLETRTRSYEPQTTSDQMRQELMPPQLADPNAWGVEDWLKQPARPEFILHFTETIRRQIASSVVELVLLGPQGSTTTDVDRNEENESLKQEVYALIDEAGEEDWDGEGALALDKETVAIALELVDRFPAYTTRPEVAATPHGEVDFDWIIDREAMLTVSVCPSKKIAFAGLFYGARLNGSEPWSGVLPRFVNCCLERLRDAQNT